MCPNMGARAERIFSLALLALIAIVVIAAALLQTYTSYLMVLIPSEFFEVLDPNNHTEKTKENLQENMKGVLLNTVVKVVPYAALANTLSYVAENLLYLKWRDYLTRRIFRKYMRNQNFYKIANRGKEEPESGCDATTTQYRLTRDLNSFCQSASGHFKEFCRQVFCVAWCTFKTVESSSWTAVALIYGYALIGIVVWRVLQIFQTRQNKNQKKYDTKYYGAMWNIVWNSNNFGIVAPATTLEEKERTALSYFSALNGCQKITVCVNAVATFCNGAVGMFGGSIPYLIIAAIFISNNQPLETPDQSFSSYISKYVGIYFMLMSNFRELIKRLPQWEATWGSYKKVKFLSDQCRSGDSGESENQEVLLEENEAEIFQPKNAASDSEAEREPVCGG